MPIVNRANYTTCPSCHRWMHLPTFTALHGNRAVICQECYERADGSKPDVLSKVVDSALRDGTGIFKVEYVDPELASKVVSAGQVARASEIKRGPVTDDELILIKDICRKIPSPNWWSMALNKLLELRGLL